MIKEVFRAGISAAKKEKRIRKHVYRAFWSACWQELVKWRTEKLIQRQIKKRFKEQCIFLDWL